MADDEAADEAGSGVCSNSSKYEENDTEALQSSSTDFSEAVSSINQRKLDSGSSKEKCLAKGEYSRKSLPRSHNCTRSAEEHSSSCSKSSKSRSNRLCLERCDSTDLIPGSEDTESDAVTSSVDAASSEISDKDQGLPSCEGDNYDILKLKEILKAAESKSRWSLSEDTLLRSLKEANDNLSWVDIGKSLNRGKSECKGRWKLIKHRVSEQLTGPGARMEDSAECRTPAPTKTTADGDSKTAASYGKQMAIGQVSHISVEDLAEIQYQKRYWHEYIGRYLYPASIRIEPDAHFSQSDCHVLGMIDARYQRMRWLETQARFYNETGRMVPLEVIRRKCDAAVRTESNIADWLERINN